MAASTREGSLLYVCRRGCGEESTQVPSGRSGRRTPSCLCRVPEAMSQNPCGGRGGAAEGVRELGVHTLTLSVFLEPSRRVFEELAGWAGGRHRGQGAEASWER